MAISTIRHDAVFNSTAANHVPVTIIGCGATGSRVFDSLVRLGLTNFRLFDPDIVESHNLANQAYYQPHVSEYKVHAALDKFWEITGDGADESGVLAFTERVPGDNSDKVEGIVFLLTDSMKSRRKIFDAVLKDNTKVFKVIETRMASSYGNVLTFDPTLDHECTAWLDTLIDDDDAEVNACGSAISVGPTAAIIANLAVWQYINVMANPHAADPVININLAPFVAATRRLVSKEAA